MKRPKFVQIAPVVLPCDGRPLLYALDEAGGVWMYINRTRTWMPVATKRGK